MSEDNTSQSQKQVTPPAAAAALSSEGSSPAAAAASGPQAKRKASRRANTAERRATHNAVERARRDTLNGRFLDLAGLLPNLSQIRRPSKSAIVNSSIAHIHASRRHRLLASRELRALKGEADALRRELNEWRDRAALPRIGEPERGEGFTMVLAGELEEIQIGPQDDDEEEGDAVGEAEPQSHENGQEQQQQQQNQEPFYHELDARANPAIYGHQGPPTPPTSSQGHLASHLQQMQHMMQHRQQQPQIHPMIVNPHHQVHFDPAEPANMHGMPQFGRHSPPSGVHYAHHFEAVQGPRSVVEEKSWAMRGYGPQSPVASFPQMNGWLSSGNHGGRARSSSTSTNGYGSPPRSSGGFDMGAYHGNNSGQGNNNYDLASSDGSSYGSVPRGLTVNTSGLGIGVGHGGQMMVSSPGGGGFGKVMMGHMG